MSFLRSLLGVAFVTTFAAIAGCSRDTTCTVSVGTPANGTQTTGYACSDRVSRAIECVPEGTKGPRCTCIANGVRGKEFHMDAMGPNPTNAIAVARDECSWAVR